MPTVVLENHLNDNLLSLKWQMQRTYENCHQGICESWLYKISVASDGGNLQANLGDGGNGLDKELWYFLFVPGYTDEAMIVNYANRVFWSVAHETDRSRIDIASTDCTNAPKFRIVHLTPNNAGPGYYAMYYTDQNATNSTFRLNSALMELKQVASSYLEQTTIEERFALNPQSGPNTQTPSWTPPCFSKTTTTTNSISELESSVGNSLAGTAILDDASSRTEHPSKITLPVVWTTFSRNDSPTAPLFDVTIQSLNRKDFETDVATSTITPVSMRDYSIEENYAGLWTILPICKNRVISQPNRKNFEDTVETNSLCSPMLSNSQKISKVINTLGAFWVAACVTFTFTLMLILREWSYERYMHMCQEIVLLLIHLIVVFTAQRTDREIVCHVVSVTLQYLYICLFCLLFLEAIQAYCIKTNVISSSFRIDYFRTHTFFIGLPVTITLPRAYFAWSNLTSVYSCWINYEKRSALSTMATVFVLSMLCLSILESTYQRNYKPLILSNPDQGFMADINLWTLWFRVSLHVASWLLMSFAIFYQRFSLFPAVFVINVSLGAVVLVSHVFASSKARRALLRAKNSFTCLSNK